MSRARHLFLPTEKQCTVALGSTAGRIHAQLLKGSVDPLWFALQLCPGADRCLIEDEVPALVCIPLRPKFLVPEDGTEAKLLEDLGYRVAVVDPGLGFNTAFIALVQTVIFTHPFVRHEIPAAVLPNPQKLSLGPQIPRGRVKQGVVLEAALRA